MPGFLDDPRCRIAAAPRDSRDLTKVTHRCQEIVEEQTQLYPVERVHAVSGSGTELVSQQAHSLRSHLVEVNFFDARSRLSRRRNPRLADNRFQSVKSLREIVVSHDLSSGLAPTPERIRAKGPQVCQAWSARRRYTSVGAFRYGPSSILAAERRGDAATA